MSVAEETNDTKAGAPAQGKLCELCESNTEHWIHCEACRQGDFDVCADCISKHDWCLNGRDEASESNPSGTDVAYQYQPLPASESDTSYLRLLTLVPGKSSEDIAANIEIWPRDSAPEYVALSYHWGDETSSRSITLSGARFETRMNLYWALHYLRAGHKPETRFWIDAICINQNDAEEKAEQVGLMRNTYERAERTVVWLGRQGDGSTAAFAMCARMLDKHAQKHFEGSISKNHWDIYDEVLASSTEKSISHEMYKTEFLRRSIELFCDRGSNCTGAEVREAALKAIDTAVEWKKHQEDADSELATQMKSLWDREVSVSVTGAARAPDWSSSHSSNVFSLENGDVPSVKEIAAMHALLRRPWFSRVWVVQEVVLPRNLTFQCGFATMAGWAFYTGLSLAQTYSPKRVADSQDLKTFFTLWSHRRNVCRQHDHAHDLHRGKSELPKLLTAFRRREATDPRDKIYGLYGLATDSIAESGFKIDYAKSLRETYQEAAISMLKISEDLQTLCLNRSSETLPDRLPTWVADWSDTSMHAAPLRGDRDVSGDRGKDYFHTPYRASGDSHRSSIKDEEDGQLSLEGYIWDEINDIAGVCHIAEEQQNFGPAYKNLANRNPFAAIEHFKGAVQHYLPAFRLYQEWEHLAGLDDPEATYPTGARLDSVYKQILMTSHDSEGVQWTSEQFEEWKIKRTRAESGLQKFLELDITALKDMGQCKQLTAGQKTSLAAMREFATLQKDQASGSRAPIEPTLYRRLVKTAKGYLALAPAATRSGDQIALLAGGRAPYVIRACGEHWQLVGTIYVHGIMNGEAWDAPQCRGMTFV